MEQRRKYRKRTLVAAVQLNLDTRGFKYKKWGSTQTCSKGDWVVNNDGDTYTVNCASFAKTYEKVDIGVFRKTTPIWAEVATKAGRVRTKEGFTSYKPGDYLVSNDEKGRDEYAISKRKFKEMYEPVDG